MGFWGPPNILLAVHLQPVSQPESIFNRTANGKVTAKTSLTRNDIFSGVVKRRKSFCKESYESKPIIIITLSWVKSILFFCAEREHKRTMHTAGNRLQMKANLVFFV